MDHDKLIEESANIFGKSLVTPTTETSNLQERGAVARVLRKVTKGARKFAGNLAGKVTASNAEAAAKAQRKAGAEKLDALSQDRRQSWQKAWEEPPPEQTPEAKIQRRNARDYLRSGSAGPSELARRKNLAQKIGKGAAMEKKYPPEA